MKIYRNIYFNDSIIKAGNGSLEIKYYGSMFNNAKFIKDFKEKYDESLDLYITCNSCAKKQIGKFTKIQK